MFRVVQTVVHAQGSLHVLGEATTKKMKLWTVVERSSFYEDNPMFNCGGGTWGVVAYIIMLNEYIS